MHGNTNPLGLGETAHCIRKEDIMEKNTTKAIQETETILFDTLTKMANGKIKPGRGSVIIHDALSILEYLNHRKLYPTL